MTPTPGGQPKPQSSQQPGNEPGGANGMYGRFGQTPGQQPSQGFRQKVDGVRRGFGGRQQRGGMRQRGGMGQMQNNNVSGMTGGSGQSNARQADRSQDQGQASSYRTSGQYDRDRAGGMQDGAVSGRETLFNATQQPMQQDQPDYGRFAPGPAADAQERAAANPFGGAGYGSGQYGSAFGNTQQPMNNAAQSTPVAPVQNTQNMGGQQSPPVAQTTQATPAPSGFASPFGMMRFGAPPAQPEQPQAEDMQPRETFQTGQSSLRQPLPSLEGQSRRRQRDRFGYGA